MRMLALTCIPALMLSGCGMLPKAEPVAYQAPVAVAKPAPVVKKAAPKKIAPKPVQSNERTEKPDVNRDGPPDPWT